jgi:hypothetical protein
MPRGQAPAVEWLVRGRFVALPGATAKHLRANVWEVEVPVTEAVAYAMRTEVTPEAFDDGVMVVGEHESMQVLGAGMRGPRVLVTVLV